jgi:hypothetical protein
LDLQQLVRDPEKAGRILGCCLLQGSVRTKGLLQILDAEQRFLSEGHGRLPRICMIPELRTRRACAPTRMS